MRSDVDSTLTSGQASGMMQVRDISHGGLCQRTTQKRMPLPIILPDARQHRSDRQGVHLQKVARTDARAFLE
jgi:hypothetical protein